MNGKIYVLQENGSLKSLEKQPYLSEDDLQALLEKYPDLLAGEQIDASNPRRWLLIKREIGVPDNDEASDRWSLDHLFLDQDAVPTLVEVKRSTDTRIRREVVGQMLDYAANSVLHWPIETIRSYFEVACKERGEDPTMSITGLLEDDTEDPNLVDEYWNKVKTNLQAGRIRLVFVADQIPIELRRIVEFLGKQMDPAEVFAVEIGQYVGEGLKTLVPIVVGQMVEPHPPPGQWDETSFLQALETKTGIEDVNVAKEILRWAKDRDLYINWGKGKVSGSFAPKLYHKGDYYWIMDVWTYGKFGFPFGWMSRKTPFDDESKRLELLNRLNQILERKIPDDAINLAPSSPLSELRDRAKLARFFDLLDWVIQEIKAG
jgi:hypothetical protein